MQAHALGMLPHPPPWDNLAALPLPPGNLAPPARNREEATRLAKGAGVSSGAGVGRRAPEAALAQVPGPGAGADGAPACSPTSSIQVATIFRMDGRISFCTHLK